MRRLARHSAWSDGRWLFCIAASFLLLTSALWAQTPEAAVLGVVTDTENRPLARVTVTATQSASGFTTTTTTDSIGEYYFASLPRGVYILAFTLEGYQQLAKQGLELAVGAKHEENAILSRLGEATASNVKKVFEYVLPQQPLPVDTLSSSVSVVVEEDKILSLPLASRNIYSLFLLQPGVTSQGAIVRRGLSFSVHGAQVSSSDYLLDGTDNNDIVLTGPAVVVSAEGIQEFRMVKSSFSAENSRATSFVAQVVTRSGSNRFHGSQFEFMANDKLNANTFENNTSAVARPAFGQNQFGYSISGPIKRNETFFTSVLESSRLRFKETQDLYLPSSFFIASLPKDSEAYHLLQENPPLPSIPTPTDPNIGFTRVAMPNHIDTWLATERVDHQLKNARDRFMGRYTLSSTSQEFSNTSQGYPGLTPVDLFRAQNTLFGWIHSFNSGQINDLRVGWNRERVDMPRPDPDVPILQTLPIPQSITGVWLPSNHRQTALRENNNVVQLADVFSVRRGRSALTMGLQYRKNFSNGLSLGIENEALGGEGRFPDGIYLFPDLHSFAQGLPILFDVATDRFSSGPLRRPDLSRNYRSGDYAAFLQDDVKINRRLSLNIGLRYEYFGVMHNTDRAKDVNFYFGPGATIEERLATAVLRSTVQNQGDLKGQLYRPDFLNFAPSVGLAWDLRGNGRTVARAGYSIAVDPIFDTVRDLRSNYQQVADCSPFTNCAPTFAIPIEPAVAMLGSNQLPPGEVVQLDANLRTPYAQNWYAGIQQTITPNLLVEIGHAGAVGRKLISRDVINRNPQAGARINVNYSDDTYLSNEGNSNYLALEASLRRRFSRGLQAQVSYTFSHAIDNQSDVFSGPRIGPGPDDFEIATFTRPFDARADRGNADFDQRHNLVVNAIWEPPALRLQSRWPNLVLGGWTISTIGAHRSGFPVTAIGVDVDPATGLRNNRMDYLGGMARATGETVPGGVQFLNPQVFQLAQGHIGTLGRGAIAGPGFWNYDFALLRTIKVGETGVRVQVRAEFYNLFNHANLSVPVTQYMLGDGTLNPQFGQAFYGLNRSYSRFGDLPLENSSRRIQLVIRIWF